MNHSELIKSLSDKGLIRSKFPKLHPLTGGVSSDIIRVDDGDNHFVVKRALAKLKVKDDWYADISRNQVEEAYLRRVDAIVPGCTPRILASNPAAGWFAMELLGDDFLNWKTQLLQNHPVLNHAERAGMTLGRIHAKTWGDPTVAREFATLENFRQLRLEPYLETTAQRVPALASLLRSEKERLAVTTIALVHGDFSPKNILQSPDRMVLLDAEVGWYGDPVFDTAFLLTHFCLKALLHADEPEAILSLVPAFWQSYTRELGPHADTGLEQRTVRLTLCLLLARIHGKSPVEYLTNSTQTQFVTAFVQQHLPNPPEHLTELTAVWQKGLCQL
jgi:tRNA A-37 threonylcarbamoyl transferase component Bud32